MRVRQQQARRYPAEFRADAVALMERRDCSYRQMAEELGVNQHTLRSWYMAEMARKKGRRPKQVSQDLTSEPSGPETPEERAKRLERENAKLRKQVAQLEEDRAILKKAAAFFAKESE